jgi:hypothetical protein
MEGSFRRGGVLGVVFEPEVGHGTEEAIAGRDVFEGWVPAKDEKGLGITAQRQFLQLRKIQR